MKKMITVIAIAFLATGCATRGANYAPMVDERGHSAADIASNTAECQQYAQRQAGAGAGAIAGAIVGALFMAALAPRGFGNNWAGAGAIAGGLGGATGANDTQENIVRRCLQGRGFNTLN